MEIGALGQKFDAYPKRQFMDEPINIKSPQAQRVFGGGWVANHSNDQYLYIKLFG